MVELEAFARELKQCMDAAGLTAEGLATETGLSVDTIRGYHRKGGRTVPKRSNVIKMSLALSWDVDTALALVDEPPTDEHELSRYQPERVLLIELEQLWPHLSPDMRQAIVDIAAAAAQPPVSRKRVARRPRRGVTVGKNAVQLPDPRDNPPDDA